MLTFDFPPRTVAIIRVIVAFVLAAVCLVVSLTMPFVKMDFSEPETVAKAYYTMNEMGLGGYSIEEVPSEINVNATKLFNIVKLAVKGAQALISKQSEKITEAVVNEETNTIRPEAVDALLIVAVVSAEATALSKKSGDFDPGKDPQLMGFLISMSINIFTSFVVLFVSMLIPIGYALIALASLLHCVSNINTPEKAVAKLARKIPQSIGLSLTILLLAAVTTVFQPAIGTYLLFVLSFVGVLCNIAATRTHTWKARKLRYANVVQGATAVSIVGYLIFFFNVIQTGIFRTVFINNDDFLTALGSNIIHITTSNPWMKEATKDSPSVWLDLILILVAVIAASVSTRFFLKLLRRESLMARPMEKDSGIASVVILIIAIALPNVVGMLNHNTYVSPAVSYLNEMTSGQKTALTVALVGLGIVFIAELAIYLLKKEFCSDIAEKEMKTVLGSHKENAVPDIETENPTPASAPTPDPANPEEP